MDSDFYRIKRLPPYVFAEVNAMKAAARARGIDIVDLGMGNPDGAPAPHVIEKLAEVARNPRAHRYSASKGIAGLRKAQAAYYARRFGVDVDPDSEVIVTLGSKEGLANLAQAITAPGDVVLAPNPTYPIHQFGFIIAGAAIRSIPAAPGPDFFDRLEFAMRYSVPKPSVLVIGYPSNPTAYVADLNFYEQVVGFAREHQLWVISDLAYAEIYFDGSPTPSILQVPGAKDVAIEFTSMSKTYSMAGWRMGFAVGNRALIHALTRIKSYLDYGAFTPIQRRRRLRSKVRRTSSRPIAASTRRAATALCRASAGPAGKYPRRPPACSLGRRSLSLSGRSARWNSPSACWPKPGWPSAPASASARKGKGSSGSHWWRMNSGSARLPAT
jgi:alanine-synthesizing transaminase